MFILRLPFRHSPAGTHQIEEIKRLNDEANGRLIVFFSIEDSVGDLDLSSVLLKAVTNLQLGEIDSQRDGAPDSPRSGSAKERRVQNKLSRVRRYPSERCLCLSMITRSRA